MKLRNERYSERDFAKIKGGKGGRFEILKNGQVSAANLRKQSYGLSLFEVLVGQSLSSGNRKLRRGNF